MILHIPTPIQEHLDRFRSVQGGNTKSHRDLPRCCSRQDSSRDPCSAECHRPGPGLQTTSSLLCLPFRKRRGVFLRAGERLAGCTAGAAARTRCSTSAGAAAAVRNPTASVAMAAAATWHSVSAMECLPSGPSVGVRGLLRLSFFARRVAARIEVRKQFGHFARIMVPPSNFAQDPGLHIPPSPA